MEEKRPQSHYIVDTFPLIIIAFIAILAALLFPFFWRIREASQASSCSSSVKQIDTAVLKYCGKHDGHFPPVTEWNNVIPRRYRRILRDCPKARSSKPVYAMNAKLEGLTVSSVHEPAHTVLVFESRPGENLSGGPELLPSEPRHYDGCFVGFVDGSVKLIPKRDVGKLVWDPKAKARPQIGE